VAWTLAGVLVVAACGGVVGPVREGADGGLDASAAADAPPEVAPGDVAEAGEDGDAKEPADAGEAGDTGDSGAEADAGAPVVVSLAISPLDSVTYVGAPPTQFTALATYSDSSTQDVTRQATWSSSSAWIVSMGATTGVATPTGPPGVVLISAALAGTTAQTSFMVTSPGVTKVVVTPPFLTVDIGCPTQMTATADWPDGTTSNVTTSASWTSVATLTATVDTNGLLQCVAAGTTEISAAFGGATGTTTVTCVAGVLVSLSVTPATASIPVGATTQFTASGTFSSGGTCDVTRNAAWQSATPSVATVTTGGNGAGLATGVVAGSSIIGASFGGRAGSATLTVQ
jgi:hypothetical protein